MMILFSSLRSDKYDSVRKLPEPQAGAEQIYRDVFSGKTEHHPQLDIVNEE